jgi:pimeloyl-ACP methyl ester carboxylesterase
MPTIVIEGCTLHYELMGSGPLLALTPGGRAAKEALLPLAQVLAGRCRVLLWDRRNTGASDLWLGTDRSEQEVWADDLAELLKRLGQAPAYIGGGSAGTRVSLLTVVRHPEAVRGLVLWSASGGPFAAQVLGYDYHVPFIRAAEAGGMEAVAKTPFFAERIAANPGNRARLLAQDPATFADVMRAWNAFFYHRPGMPVQGVTEAQLRAISVPTLAFEGNDDIHSREASDALARLVPGVEMAACPWSRDEFTAYYTGRRQGGIMQSLYPRMAPRILAFLEKLEARGPRR